MSLPTIPSKVLTKVDGTVGTMRLYGIIGQNEYWNEERKQLAITDVEIVQKLEEIEAAGATRCNVRLNSPGGSVFHGDGIISALKDSSMDVHVYVDGMAASMAADIFLSIKKENRHMTSNSKMMIHAPMDGAFGNAKKHRLTAEKLEAFEDAAIAKMVEDTGMKAEDVRAQFYDGEDHWLTSKKAVELGFISKVETYESESIDGVEKMSHADVMKLFFQTSKLEENIFQKTFSRLQKVFGGDKHNSQTNDDDMKTVEDIQKAIEAGTIDEKALLAAIGAEKKAAPTPPANPAPAPTTEPKTEASVEDAIKAAIAPLMAKIEKLEKAPAATPTTGNIPEDEFKNMTEPQKRNAKRLEELDGQFAKRGYHESFSD